MFCRNPELNPTIAPFTPEGPFNKIERWVEEMKAWLASEGKSYSKLYFYYTTCPKCAKKYGKNYVALLAQIS